jgi:hypothetical protein
MASLQSTASAASLHVRGASLRFKNLLIVIKQTAFEEYSQVKKKHFCCVFCWKLAPACNDHNRTVDALQWEGVALPSVGVSTPGLVLREN